MNQSNQEKNQNFIDFTNTINLLFDSNNENKLNDFINYAKSKNKDYEFEIRFQNIKQYDFLQIKKSIVTDKFYIKIMTDDSISTLLPGDIRHEAHGQKNETDYYEQYQLKKDKNEKIKINDIDIKINLSHEKNITLNELPNNINLANKISTRKKKE